MRRIHSWHMRAVWDHLKSKLDDAHRNIYTKCAKIVYVHQDFHKIHNVAVGCTETPVLNNSY